MARKKSSVVEQVVGPWRNRITGYGEEDPRQLLANDRNWRIHTHDQEKSLSAVLNKVGIVQSILVNKRSGKVVDGHLRAAMAISEGQSRVPVVYVDLSDEEEALILATFDRITAMAGVDNEKLEELVTEAAENFPDLAEILNGIEEYIERGGPETSRQGLTEDDVVPEPQEAVVTTLGDCWLLGAHRLICGDSTDVRCVERLMAGGLADMVFTDPPYNVDYEGKTAKKLKIGNDALGGRFYEFLRDASANMLAVTKGAIYMCMACSELHTLYSAFSEAGGHWSTYVIWAKHHFTLGRSDYQRMYEPILYGWRKGTDHFWCGARDQGDVWFIKRPASSQQHPTMKPVELVERAIRNSSKTRDTILDPFGGSGTTMIACEKTGRTARLMELDPKYCDVIVRRWQEYTGQKATLDGTDRTFDEISAERQPVAA